MLFERRQLQSSLMNFALVCYANAADAVDAVDAVAFLSLNCALFLPFFNLRMFIAL